MTHRPQCVECGDRYGARTITTETVRWPKGEPIPPYIGDGWVVNTAQPYTLATPRGAPPMFTTTRSIWDGESWDAKQKPFCTMQCALQYAREAYEAAQAAKL